MKPDVKAFFHERAIRFPMSSRTRESTALRSSIQRSTSITSQGGPVRTSPIGWSPTCRSAGLTWPDPRDPRPCRSPERSPYLKSKLGGRIGIGEHITEVQALFKKLFNVEKTFNTDGSQFDHLFEDGETFAIGALQAKVMYTSGIPRPM